MTPPTTMAIKIINSLPIDASYDEIIKELAFNRMIKKDLEDSKNGLKESLLTPHKPPKQA